MSTLSKKFDSPPARSVVPTGTALRVDLTIDAWSAADLSMSLLAVVERPAHRYLDAGATWRDRAATLPDDFLARLDRYGKETWINLLGLPMDVPAARDGDGLVTTLRELPADEVLRYLAGYFRRCFRRETPAAVMEAAIDGDAKARKEFRRTSFADLPMWRDTLRHLLSAPAEEIRADFADLVGTWQREVFAAHQGAYLEATRRDAQTLRQSTDGLPVEAIVERAVPPVTFVPEVGQTSVVLVPSVAVKPLFVVVDHRTANLFVYPTLADREDAGPPARLVALGKAIGDETRLRILRELATEPATPPDLASRMGIPRTTLLHHLSLLRRAGLIAVNVHDSAYHTYMVRDERLGDIGRLLETYLSD
jgi:DNA-binding transcriptional ArsR family regulator